jgi:hypothetical protein
MVNRMGEYICCPQELCMLYSQPLALGPRNVQAHLVTLLDVYKLPTKRQENLGTAWWLSELLVQVHCNHCHSHRINKAVSEGRDWKPIFIYDSTETKGERYWGNKDISDWWSTWQENITMTYDGITVVSRSAGKYEWRHTELFMGSTERTSIGAGGTNSLKRGSLGRIMSSRQGVSDRLHWGVAMSNFLGAHAM